MLYGAGQRGYLRFVNGDINTATKRLNDSFVGPFEFDLALIRGETFGTSAAKQVCDLAHFMTTGGALVLTCETESFFLQIWNELRKLSPKFNYVQCRDRKSGMAISLSPSDTNVGAADNVEIVFANHWYTASMIRNKIAYTILKIVRPTVLRFRKMLKAI
jgi:hypothetical protein